MSQTADRLARMLETVPPRLADIRRRRCSQWIRRGPLVEEGDPRPPDRFRRQQSPALRARASCAGITQDASYQQEHWVSAQGYATESWPDLVNLWLLYNRHLLHVVRNVRESALTVPCTIGGSAPVPLSEVMSSYVDHMEHHLAQILG